MMTGIRWGFEEVNGEERLKAEMRVNIEIVPFLHFKLFWLLQVAYFIVPILLILTQFFISTNIQVAFSNATRPIILNLITLTGASTNLFIFFRAYLSILLYIAEMNENHYYLKYKLGR